MMANSFKDYVLEQLAGLGSIRCRSMFGGHGLYLEDVFFAIIHQGRLYFKTHEHTRDDYLRSGSEPFQPNAHQTLASYLEVPALVLEDEVMLSQWAAQAAATDS